VNPDILYDKIYNWVLTVGPRLPGILILMLKPFRIGDNIVAQGQDGIVSSIQLFYTVIITHDNKTVIIPNSKLSNEVIINISRQGKRRLDMEVKFNYGFDFSTIKSIVMKTLKDLPEAADHPAPAIGVSVLDPDGFKVMINTWVDAKSFETSKLLIQQKVIEDLKVAGMKLPGMT
jgi:small conductance mechanosensitive channel